jgi:hypothetical protein
LTGNSCIGSIPNFGSVANGGAIDTKTVGPKTLTVNANDAFGTAQKSVTYNVVYNWNGFYAPIDNASTGKVNTTKAGSSVPLKFSLDGPPVPGSNTGNFGTDPTKIFAPGYPQTQAIMCDTGAVDSSVPIDYLTTAGNSGLQYDAAADQYIWVWKTNGSYANTCRQVVFRLSDGTEITQRVNFKFSK